MTFATGLDGLDPVDNILTRHHATKYGVAPTLGRDGGVVEEAVVSYIDEKLSGGRVRVASTGHSHGVVEVLQAVVGLVVDRFVTAFFFHAGFHAAALHHEAGDDAVKNGVVVVTLVYVAQKVCHRFRCFFGIQFKGDDTVVRYVKFDLGLVHDLFHQGCRVDKDRGFGDVRGERSAGTSGACLHFLDNVHATDNLAEHGIAVRLYAGVQKRVVLDINKKLRAKRAIFY